MSDILARLCPPSAAAMLDGWIEGEAHLYPLLVQFEDTDAGGIVYHANYLSFAERGRSAWLRCLGISQQSFLQDQKVGFVVRRATLDYQRPAHLNDEVIVETRLQSGSAVRMIADQTIRGVEAGKKVTDGHIFAKVEVEIVMVNEIGRPIRFPKEIFAKMMPEG